MLAIDSETTGLAIHKGCQAFTLTAVCDQHKTYLWRFRVNPLTRKVIYDPEVLQDFKDTVAKHEQLIFHHANFDLQVLVALGYTLEDLFDNHDIHDTMLMSHCFKSDNMHGLKQLGVTILGFPEDDEKLLSDITKQAVKEAKKLDWNVATKHNKHLLGAKKEFYKSDYWVPEEIAHYLKYPKDHPYRTVCNEYAINDTVRTMGIFQIFSDVMTAKQKLAYHRERRLIRPILDMQYEKVTLLPKELEKAHKEYTSKATIQLVKLRRMVGDRNFNPGSPVQLQSILFDKYKFPVKRVSEKTGEPTTNKEVISILLKDCPKGTDIPERFKFLVELKRYKKTRTTIQYIKNYIVHADSNNAIQPFLKQTGTNTGRFSCENPNLTNVGNADMANPYAAKDAVITQEDEESFKLRNVFGPTPGNIWTCIDYTQFQLLIFAVASKNDQLVQDYLNGIDLHEATARQIFQTNDISAVQRTNAKNVNFGILFGAGPHKIDETAGVPGLYNLFCSRLPGAKKYLAEQAHLVRTKGYVHTLGGKRLYVPRDRDYAASCYVIQGTEAEIVKSAIVDLHAYTVLNISKAPTVKLKSKCPYRMILPVHDEIIFRSRRTNDDHLRNLMRIMEHAGTKIGVPVRVDADIVTNNWASKTSYTPATT